MSKTGIQIPQAPGPIQNNMAKSGRKQTSMTIKLPVMDPRKTRVFVPFEAIAEANIFFRSGRDNPKAGSKKSNSSQRQFKDNPHPVASPVLACSLYRIPGRLDAPYRSGHNRTGCRDLASPDADDAPTDSP